MAVASVSPGRPECQSLWAKTTFELRWARTSDRSEPFNCLVSYTLLLPLENHVRIGI